MAYSSLVGADKAPLFPSGRSSDLLGPSDNSDSGSDAMGTGEIHGDSDSVGTGERGVVSGVDAKEGGDILPDRVVRIGGPDGNPEAWADEEVFTDLDEVGAMEDDPESPDDEEGADIDRRRRTGRGPARPDSATDTAPDAGADRGAAGAQRG